MAVPRLILQAEGLPGSSDGRTVNSPVNRTPQTTISPSEIDRRSGVRSTAPTTDEVRRRRIVVRGNAQSEGDTGTEGGGRGRQPQAPSTEDVGVPQGAPQVQETEPIGPVDFAELQGLSEEEIQAALQFLEAQFGLTREQLIAAEGDLGDVYRVLTAQLTQNRAAQLRDVEHGAIERGILRSGIALEQQGDVEQAALSQQQQLETDRQTRIETIQAQISQLNAQLAAEQASVAAQLEQGNFTFEQQQSLQDFLAGLPVPPQVPGLVLPPGPNIQDPLLPLPPLLGGGVPAAPSASGSKPLTVI